MKQLLLAYFETCSRQILYYFPERFCTFKSAISGMLDFHVKSLFCHAYLRHSNITRLILPVHAKFNACGTELFTSFLVGKELFA